MNIGFLRPEKEEREEDLFLRGMMIVPEVCVLSMNANALRAPGLLLRWAPRLESEVGFITWERRPSRVGLKSLETVDCRPFVS